MKPLLPTEVEHLAVFVEQNGDDAAIAGVPLDRLHRHGSRLPLEVAESLRRAQVFLGDEHSDGRALRPQHVSGVAAHRDIDELDECVQRQLLRRAVVVDDALCSGNIIRIHKARPAPAR